MEERYVDIDGIRVRYVTEGHGPPVLLIHGLGEFLEDWSRNIAPLSKYFSVYALDLPGHGLSGKPLRSYTLDFTSAFIIRFMQALGIEHASLMGHSFGAVVCLNMALSFREKVNKLVLVDAGGLSKKMPFSYRLTALPVLGHILLGPRPFVNKATIRMGLKMKRQFYNPNIVDEAWIDAAYRCLKRPERNDTIVNIIRSNVKSGQYPGASILDNLHLVNVSTLVVHGAQDRVAPIRYVQLLCDLIPDARCEVIDECGHFPQMEKAAQFNEAVIAFLSTEKRDAVPKASRSPGARWRV